MSDRDSTLQLYLQHRAALLAYATPIVGCPSRAEDIVQEAYLRYSPAAAAGVRNPVAYLYRIVRNLSLDTQRSLKPEFRRADSSLLTESLPEGSAGPEQIAVHADELRAVAEVLASLPDRTRRAFQLYQIDGLTLQETATQMGLSVSYVQELVRTAMARCADLIRDVDDEDD